MQFKIDPLNMAGVVFDISLDDFDAICGDAACLAKRENIKAGTRSERCEKKFERCGRRIFTSRRFRLICLHAMRAEVRIYPFSTGKLNLNLHT